ncbi:hypothetical protein ACFSC4_02010 [Deinococcus malanensis]|uniref:hypothetical protein n=1 Tax=Deinococcus malanensis TaxID=1706855 RepID=UPI003638E800
MIRLGPRHRFSVNTQPLDLTLLPRGDELAVHLTGTDYMQPLTDPALNELRDFWQVTLDSESPLVYRSEYLAGQILQAAEEGRDGLDLPTLRGLVAQPEELARRVREFAAPRYREGYEKGIHDHDTALILQKLLPLAQSAGPLAFPPLARALAVMAWASQPERQADWTSRFGSAHAMRQLFGTTGALQDAVQSLAADIGGSLQGISVEITPEQCEQAAAYLAEELRSGEVTLGFTRYAAELLAGLEARLAAASMTDGFRQALQRLEGQPAGRWELTLHWLNALTGVPEFADRARYVPEAAALSLFGSMVRHEVRDVTLMVRVDGLLGEHPRVQGAV